MWMEGPVTSGKESSTVSLWKKIPRLMILDIMFAYFEIISFRISAQAQS